jgi:hypothetical protein
MAERLGLWSRVWGSAWNAAAYRDAAAGRVGRMIGYLAVLITIATVCLTIRAQVTLGQVLEVAKPWVKAHIPEIQITKGTASSPVKQPYIWEEGGMGFVLDTTGATTNLAPKYERGVLLTKTELVYRQSPIETRRYELAQLPDMVINEATIGRVVDLAKSWLWLAIAVGLFLWLWIAKLFQVLFGSLLGLLVNALSKRALRYGALFNIGVLALTVSTAFDVVIGLTGARIPAQGLLSLALYLGYLAWGILSQPSAAEATAATPASTAAS